MNESDAERQTREKAGGQHPPYSSHELNHAAVPYAYFHRPVVNFANSKNESLK